MKSLVLPNGLTVKHINTHETVSLYEDIFVQRVYVKHGITVPENSIVLDIGANIGLFTLFVVEHFPSAQIHAFEPAVKTFQHLSENTRAHDKVQAVNCGMGSQSSEELFTYFPNATTGSGFYQDGNIQTMKARMYSEMVGHLGALIPYEASQEEKQELLRYRLEVACSQPEFVPTRVRTVSSYIEEKKLPKVGLLKVDVEGKESDVLRGIQEDHWSLIDQAVIEVHARVSDSLPDVLKTLKKNKFRVTTVPEPGMLTTMVYAIR